MGKVILLLGPHGVGKTALVEYARYKKEFLAYDGFKISIDGYDLTKIDDFILCQEIYIQKASDICDKIKRGTVNGIVLRSLEESMFYCELYSNPDMARKLLKLTLKKRNYEGADFIVFLTATRTDLQERCAKDHNRNIVNTEIWYNFYYLKYEEYWRSYPNVIFINTSGKTISEVYNEFKKVLIEKGLSVK